MGFTLSVFSTDPSPAKSKIMCMWFAGQSEQLDYPSPITLNGVALPWVETADHLGHKLHQTCNMDYDASCKRAPYIDKTTTLQETFSYARPEEKLLALSVYAGGLYGYAPWDLYGQKAKSAFKC